MKNNVVKQRKEFRRVLLSRETVPEKLFSNFLNSNNVKHKKQFAIHPFIVDFFFPCKGVIVELDGGVHERHISNDDRRDSYLFSLGLCVLRYKNNAKHEKILKDVDSFKNRTEEDIAILSARMDRVSRILRNMEKRSKKINLESVYSWLDIIISPNNKINTRKYTRERRDILYKSFNIRIYCDSINHYCYYRKLGITKKESKCDCIFINQKNKK